MVHASACQSDLSGPVLGLDWSVPRFAQRIPSDLPGYFPFLFYGPEWVGEIYFEYDAPNSHSKDRTGQIGKIGSTALIIFSIVTFVASVCLPPIVEAPDQAKTAFTVRPPSTLKALAPMIETLRKHRPTLSTAWFASHLVFAAAMSLAPLVKSVHLATMLIAVCGLLVLQLPCRLQKR